MSNSIRNRRKQINLFDRIVLLATGLVVIYSLYLFFMAYQKTKDLYYAYYIQGFGVLLVSGLLPIILGWDILAFPLVLMKASAIPLRPISIGSQLLFFSPDFVLMILAPLLLAMTLAFTWGFRKNLLKLSVRIKKYPPVMIPGD